MQDSTIDLLHQILSWMSYRASDKQGDDKLWSFQLYTTAKISEDCLRLFNSLHIAVQPTYTNPILPSNDNPFAAHEELMKHFQQSSYRVYGVVPWNGPVGSRKHMWKKDGED